MNLKNLLAAPLLSGALLLSGTLLAQSARAETVDYDALDEATRAAIKQACHGWIFQDAVNRIASWIDAVAPLCDAEEAARLRALAQPAQPVPPKQAIGQVPSDIGGTGSWDPIRIECQNEYMCVTQRKRAEVMGRPVNLAEYQRIAADCDGEYWCIEAAFDKLPDLDIPPAAQQ